MDIRLCFRSASKSSVVSSSSYFEDGNKSEIDVQPNPPKKHCSSSTSKPPSKSGSGIRKYNKKWEETFPWLEFDENIQGAFCKYAKTVEDLFRGLVGLGLPNHSLTGRRRLRKWNHIQKVKCTFYPVNNMEADRARKEGSIISQLQNVGGQQILKNRKVIKALIRCTHFLAHQYIAHTTNFDKLIELVVSCGGKTLQTFRHRAGGNATYT